MPNRYLPCQFTTPTGVLPIPENRAEPLASVGRQAALGYTAKWAVGGQEGPIRHRPILPRRAVSASRGGGEGP